MNCRKCGHKVHERIVKPFDRKQSITLYECKNPLCEYHEDDDPRRHHLHRRG